MKNEEGGREMVGALPEQYRPPPKSATNKYYMIIPILICGCLLWFAYNQWQNPPQIQNIPVEQQPKQRIWWLPDLLQTLPPFANGYRVEKHLERYNLTSCSIYGNFPEINAAVFCFLLNPAKYKRANKTISTDLQFPGYCGAEPPLTLSSFDQWQKYLTKPSRKIAIVQNPLDRFARQFHKICEVEKKCYDCKSDVNCLMRKVFNDHKKVAEGLDGNTRNYVTTQFSPQTWNCHFNFNYPLIEPLKIGGNDTEKANFIQGLTRILDQQGVDKTLRETIQTEIMKIPMSLTPEERRIVKMIREDQDKLRIFRYLYEHDYTIFGFPL